MTLVAHTGPTKHLQHVSNLRTHDEKSSVSGEARTADIDLTLPWNITSPTDAPIFFNNVFCVEKCDLEFSLIKLIYLLMFCLYSSSLFCDMITILTI